MIARAADGSMRDALSLTDQVLSMGDGRVTAERVRDALGLVAEDEFIAMLDLIADRRAADVFPAVARLAEAGIDFGALSHRPRRHAPRAAGAGARRRRDRSSRAHARGARSAPPTLRDGDLLRMLQSIGSWSRASERADNSSCSSRRYSCASRCSTGRWSSRMFCGRSVAGGGAPPTGSGGTGVRRSMTRRRPPSRVRPSAATRRHRPFAPRAPPCGRRPRLPPSPDPKRSRGPGRARV